MIAAQMLIPNRADLHTSVARNCPKPSRTDFGDFLRKGAQTRLRGFFRVCGLVWQVSTNSQSILKAAQETFDVIDKPGASLPFHIRFWVDGKLSASPPWPKPYVRGLDHLVFGSFDCGSSVLIDLAGRRLVGRFSKPMAADRDYWKTVIFPVLLSIVSGSAGLAEIHGACVSRGNDGLLLVGPSGSGKSTLSLALARMGLRFISDDRTFCWLHSGRLRAWGTLALLKLRPDGGRWFEEIKNDTLNRNRELRFDPQERLGINRARQCHPRMVIFLERSTHSGLRLRPVASSEAARLLQQDLMAELPAAAKRQAEIIEELSDLPNWHLQYGAPPQVIAQELLRQFEQVCHSRTLPLGFFERGKPRPIVAQKKGAGPNYSAPTSVSAQMRARTLDPLHRFSTTPYTGSLPIMGRTIRLETNDKQTLKHVTELLAGYPGSSTSSSEFLWRIVRQHRPQANLPWPKRFAFSGSGVRFAQFGHGNFVAVDLDLREAVGFLSGELIEDDVGLTSPILDNLFCMTVGSLRLVPLRANCVALGQKGLLVFGAPNSGKTTACYFAKKLGLEFYADEGVFMESQGGEVNAWGGFWPAAFRPEALRFLPELRTTTRPFHYPGFTFHHLNEHPSRSSHAFPVKPVGCVFLDRQAVGFPDLSLIDNDELSARLVDNVLFKDDARFLGQQAALLGRLEKLPAYHLPYSDSPELAALCMGKILADWKSSGAAQSSEISEITLSTNQS